MHGERETRERDERVLARRQSRESKRSARSHGERSGVGHADPRLGASAAVAGHGAHRRAAPLRVQDDAHSAQPRPQGRERGTGGAARALPQGWRQLHPGALVPDAEGVLQQRGEWPPARAQGAGQQHASADVLGS